MKQDIDIDQVDVESVKFCFDYPLSMDSSITHAESPPLPPILYLYRNSYAPIWGRYELNRCAQRGRSVPWATVIEGFRTIREAIRYSIEVKLQTGGFSVIEKALALKRLYDFNDSIEEDVLRRLDVPRKESIIKRYLLLADAPEEIKEKVNSGVLHENTAFVILDLDMESWSSVADFICSLSLGTKKRNELIHMLCDIAKRDGIDLREIINSKTVRVVLDKNMDPSHVGAEVYGYIQGLRYPSVRLYRERFENKLKEVKLDSRFHLQLPENFEKWEFRMVVPFSSDVEFQQNLDLLQNTARKTAFNELMSMRY
jgi:hypothetical protein